jgi:hypothetical protein
MGTTARNDITGMAIKSRAQTESYRQGWDAIFAKKTPEEWIEERYQGQVTIIDPDGWRQDDTPFDKPITFRDFSNRLSLSTIVSAIPLSSIKL